MAYRLAFIDEMPGDVIPEDMGVALPTVQAAKEFAERNWLESTQMGDDARASDITWDGPVGSATYEYRMGPHSPTHEAECHYLITRQ